jgi:hypothetical protein
LLLHIACQIQCNALPGLAGLCCGILYMQAAYPDRGFLAEPEPVANAYLAAQCRAGHHQPGSAEAEGTVDGQTKTLAGWLMALTDVAAGAGAAVRCLRRCGWRQRKPVLQATGCRPATGWRRWRQHAGGPNQPDHIC